MKGLAYADILDLIKDKFGLEMLDEIIYDESSGSKVLIYDFDRKPYINVSQLLFKLNLKTSISSESLIKVYLDYFFNALKESYEGVIRACQSAIDMIIFIVHHILHEVQKVYPKSSLPKVVIEGKKENSITLLYTSSKFLRQFGIGVMHKTFEYFNEKAKVDVEEITPDGTMARFVVQKVF